MLVWHRNQFRIGIFPSSTKLRALPERKSSCSSTAAAAAAYAPMPALRPPPYELRALPNKGIGVIATSAIPAGTLLLVSAPLVILRSNTGTKHTNRASADAITAAVAALDPMLAAAYNALASAPTAASHELGVWKSNNFCLDDEGTLNAVFDLPSRLNHSCVGGENARWEWDEVQEVIRFYADKDIEVSFFDIKFGEDEEEEEGRNGEEGRCASP